MYSLLKNKSIFLLFIMGVFLFVNISSLAKKNQPLADFEESKFNTNFRNYNQKIKFTNNLNHNIAEFMIAIADTPEKQQYGLMNLDFLPQNLGMIFIKEQTQNISMWMKNTLIPLDMIFLDENFIVNHIAENTTPHSLAVISSPYNSRAVLEVNAGIAKKFNIKIGDKLIINKL
ncbi:MAG: DUF192 domain-containing protein [Proteobacteria bacterium]|nr:DUF192 domain-containing protein [Pseudomonadota bacterium]NCA28792.1 DUF192 domain-containing protein [Pseudomonadota bacterium]